MQKKLLAIAAAGLMAGPMAAYAAPVVFDFTGAGTLCVHIGGGGGPVCSPPTKSFTGTVTLDVNESGPSGPDSSTDGSTLAYDYNGWVHSDFLIQWGADSFNPGPLANQTYSDFYAHVNNTSTFDRLYNQEHYSRNDGTSGAVSSAYLVRQTSDTSWLNSVAFDTSVGLAPGTGALNQIYFENYSWAYNSDLANDEYFGYFGTIDLSSFTARPTSVPEPGTLALFGLGLAGLGLIPRRLSA